MLIHFVAKAPTFPLKDLALLLLQADGPETMVAAETIIKVMLLRTHKKSVPLAFRPFLLHALKMVQAIQRAESPRHPRIIDAPSIAEHLSGRIVAKYVRNTRDDTQTCA